MNNQNQTPSMDLTQGEQITKVLEGIFIHKQILKIDQRTGGNSVGNTGVIQFLDPISKRILVRPEDPSYPFNFQRESKLHVSDMQDNISFEVDVGPICRPKLITLQFPKFIGLNDTRKDFRVDLKPYNFPIYFIFSEESEDMISGKLADISKHGMGIQSSDEKFFDIDREEKITILSIFGMEMGGIKGKIIYGRLVSEIGKTDYHHIGVHFEEELPLKKIEKHLFKKE